MIQKTSENCLNYHANQPQIRGGICYLPFQIMQGNIG